MYVGVRKSFRPARSAIPVLTWIAVCACVGDMEPADPVEGQWSLRMYAGDSGNASLVNRGVLVIDPELTRYPDDPARSDSAVIGRAYMSGRAAPESHRLFLHGAGADRIETAHILVRDSQVVIILAPHLKDASPVLVGRLREHRIQGRWSTTADGVDSDAGSFTLRRTNRNGYSDSATARARREVRIWDAS